MSGIRRVGYGAVALSLSLGLGLLAAGEAAAQSALQLGASNAYVTFGDPAKLKLSTFTLETWFRRDGAGVTNTTGTGGITDMIPLVTKGAPEADGSNVDANYVLGISGTNSVLAVDFEDNATGLNHPLAGVTTIVTGTWYHAAATYDGSTWRLYLNGVLEAEAFVGFSVRNDSIQRAALGTMLTSTGTALGFFNGTLDEARIWNVARTAADIRSTINSELTSGTGLVARWGLNDGAGLTVTDSIATAANGTITGTGSSWVASAPFDLAVCSNNESGNLRFDGTNDYVTFGNATKLKLANFTLETWFIRTAAGTGVSTGTGGIASLVPLITKGAGEGEAAGINANYILGINTAGNVLAADFEEDAAGSGATGLNHPISGTTALVNNRWYHAAATYDGTTWRLYLDGAPEASLTVGEPTSFNDNQHAGLGTTLTSTGTAAGFFAGVMDEVRIWNFAKSAAQVASEYQQQISSASGLVGRWALDDGSGPTIADSVAPTVAGTLTNGPVFGRSAIVFSRNATCSDSLFCNGTDTCNGSGLRCALHAGDPCVGGSECSDACNEAADNCFDTVGTPCTADGNVCTDDVCSGAGSCGVNNTAPCDDGLFCNGTDTCSGGTCGHTGDPCVGGSECSDACNEAADNCFDTAGTPCTTDGNVCTDDVCSGAGSCGVNNTAPCADGLFCNGADTCSGGSCVVHAGDPCPGPDGDGNCSETCNEAADNCTAPDVNGSACTDGLFCTGSDFCQAGTCSTHTGNPCPGPDGDGDCSESCNEAADDCSAADTNGSACTDSLFCNGTDTCQSGNCSVHSGDPCFGPDGDGNCSESCNETADDCSAPDPNGSICNDGLFCNGADTCQAGACSTHAGDPCPGPDGDIDCSETCNEAADNCSTADPDGTTCTDNLFCNGADTCQGGTCSTHAGDPCPGPDGDIDCSETCNEAADDCTAADPNGSACTDGTFCNGADSCQAGACSTHAGDPCPGPDGDGDCTESCDESTDSCTANDPVGSACTDGLFCNGTDTCLGSACGAHTGDPCPGADGDGNCAESCDEAGDTCTAADPNGSACTDGTFCNGADSCQAGACTGHAGDPCPGADGDGNCAESCDESADACTGNDPDGSACNDSNSCSLGETCTGGACSGGSVTVCPACQACTPLGGCQVGPRDDCRVSTVALKSKLQLKDKTPDTADLVNWKWIKGQQTDLPDFGDPLNTTSYTLCVFDGVSNLVLQTSAPAGGTCGTNPCWKLSGTSGFKYKDRDGTPDGLTNLSLKAGLAGFSKVQVKGKGLNLVMPTLPLTLPVSAQLQSSDGECWATTHDTAGVQTNDATQFKAKDSQ